MDNHQESIEVAPLSLQHREGAIEGAHSATFMLDTVKEYLLEQPDYKVKRKDLRKYFRSNYPSLTNPTWRESEFRRLMDYVNKLALFKKHNGEEFWVLKTWVLKSATEGAQTITFTLDTVMEYLLEQPDYKVKGEELFEYFFSNYPSLTDPTIEDSEIARLGDYLDKLALSKQENGEQFCILKCKYYSIISFHFTFKIIMAWFEAGLCISELCFEMRLLLEYYIAGNYWWLALTMLFLSTTGARTMLNNTMLVFQKPKLWKVYLKWGLKYGLINPIWTLIKWVLKILHGVFH